MPRYIPPSDEEWDDAIRRVLGKQIDFSDTLLVLQCGCILDGCIGAAGVDLWLKDPNTNTKVYCGTHHWTVLEQIVTVGEL